MLSLGLTRETLRGTSLFLDCGVERGWKVVKPFFCVFCSSARFFSMFQLLC